MPRKEGQVTIFIIIAVVIVGLVAAIFFFQSDLISTNIPSELQPVFTYYEGCIERETSNGIQLAGSQGGRIELGDYTAGSDYSPFSSHLTFLGFQIPYWYFLTGNNLIKENVPTRAGMQVELADFVEEQLTSQCDFSLLEAQGFEITVGTSRVTTYIDDTQVRTSVNAPITVSKGDTRATKQQHTVTVASKLGKFHTIAKEIYDKEKSEAFLEGYAVDVLRLYAPVDGVYVQCSPHIWRTPDVVANLTEAIGANFAQIAFEGDTNIQAGDRNEYFVVDHSVDEHVRIMYSEQWPRAIEITPAGQELMIAEPAGNEENLGVAGFCYVPYHFVYDLKFPALVQIYDDSEVFQFPVAVIVDNNLPREGLASSIEPDVSTDVCSFMTTDATVRTYDTSLNPIPARIRYECFDTICDIGSTSDTGDAVLEAQLPACLNGYLIAESEGYVSKKQLFSSNSESQADIILDREHAVSVGLTVGAKPFEGTAIIHFDDGTHVTSMALPQATATHLHEGLYNITVYAYGSSGITIPASTTTQCQKVSREGVLGFFGATQEQCFDIQVPETTVEYALVGGGSSEVYILESELEKGSLVLKVPMFTTPSSLEQIQYNFASLEDSRVEVVFA